MRTSLLCSCLESSSAHGISHAARGTTPFQRGFWLVFFFGASAAFVYYCQENFTKYYSEPTSVTVQLFGAKFIPPDIHLCHINPLAKSRLTDSWTIQNSSDMRNLLSDMRRLEDILNSVNVTGDYQALYFWQSIDKAKLFKAAGHMREQTILMAGMDTGKKFQSDDFEVVSSFNYFSCFRVSLSNETKHFGTSNNLALYLYTDSYHLESTPLNFSDIPLSLFDYIEAPSVLAPAGIMLVFTPPGRYPHVESHSVLLSPGRYTTIKLRMQKTIAARTSRNSCKQYNETVDYHNHVAGRHVTVTYVKSFADCKYRKIVEKLLKFNPECQCIPYMVPISFELAKKYPICGNMLQADHFNRSLWQVKEEVRCDDIYYSYDAEFNSEECHMDKPCETIRYASDVSSTDWPLNSQVDNIIEQVLKPNLEDSDAPGLKDYLLHIKENSTYKNDLTKYNFAWATISPGETRSQLIEESVIYGLENLISDTGGLAGLYLGMSFLTLMEVLNLVHDYFYNKIQKKRGKEPKLKEMTPFI